MSVQVETVRAVEVPTRIVHGLGASTHWWDPVVPMLAKSYRVIRIDLLGHGRSAKPAGGGYAIPEQGRVVARPAEPNGRSGR